MARITPPPSAAFIAALLVIASGSSASATVYRGQISDPMEHSADGSHDLTGIDSAFDNASGRWSVEASFARAPDVATSARLYLSLVPSRSQCPLGAGGLGMGVETGQTFSSFSQTCRRPTTPDPRIA